MFSQFTRLRSLDLQQNHITMVEAGAFAGLSGLTTLLLQHNRLREFGEEALLPMPRLAYLRLYDNPWSCGCGLESLAAVLRVPSNRNLGNYAKCAAPPALKGQKLKSLIPETMCVGEDRHLAGLSSATPFAASCYKELPAHATAKLVTVKSSRAQSKRRAPTLTLLKGFKIF